MDFNLLFHSCTTLRLGRRLHTLLVTDRHRDVLLSTKLLNLYSLLADPLSVALTFSHLPTKNIFAFDSIISCHVHHNHLPTALASSFYLLLSTPSLRPDRFTFPVLLKACSNIKQLTSIHSHIIKLGFTPDVFISSSLINMYVRFALVTKAENVFEEMPERDSGAWNALISAFCQNGEAAEAAQVFKENDVGGSCCGYGHGGERAACFRTLIPLLFRSEL